MSKALEQLSRDFAAAATEEDASLKAARRSALERFAAVDFPGPRAEAWRQLNVAALARRSLNVAWPQLAVLDDDLSARLATIAEDGPIVVLVNGRLSQELSMDLPAGITARAASAGTVAEPATQLAARSQGRTAAGLWAFEDLNAALCGDLVTLSIAAGVETDVTVQLVHVVSAGSADALACPRITIEAGEGSRARLVERYLTGAGERPLTVGFEAITLERGATLELEIADDQADDAGRIGRLEATLGDDARLAVRCVTLSDALCRLDVVAGLAGPGADFTFDGLTLTQARQHAEYLVLADHQAPETTSNQTFKAIGGGNSKAVFTTCARVAKDAQHIDSKQLSRGLLLSDGASVHTRPQLEIYADDVACAHGATVGQLDEDALFYLRARGVPERQARTMLLDAFAEDLIDGFHAEGIRDAARTRAHALTHAND